MRMASVGQLALMTAIVATMAYFPLGLALIFLLHFAGVGYETLISFGGTFGTVTGLIVWWLLAFIAAAIYAAFVFPWQ